VFKLTASLDDQVSQFNQLVGAGKLTGPESPNAFDLLIDLSAKYPDRTEVATMRSTLVPRLTDIADAAVNATLSKWRGVNRAEIERGQMVSECIAKLKSDDNRAGARVAYLKGVIAMRDWLIGAPGQNGAAQGQTPDASLAQARDSLNAAVQADGSWTVANYRLGRLLLFSGNADAAQASFVKTTQLDPNWAPGHVGLADAYYAAGKRKEAVAEYQKAVKLDPASARAYAGLGLARWSTGESKDGLKDIERAIQLDPSTGLPHLNLAIVYADSKKKKDRDKAVEELNEAIKRNPDNLEFRNEVAAHLIAGANEHNKK
jgi:tetratricopeptide (TPR) repeat protein